jgi:hypothetical protein
MVGTSRGDETADRMQRAAVVRRGVHQAFLDALITDATRRIVPADVRLGPCRAALAKATSGERDSVALSFFQHEDACRGQLFLFYGVITGCMDQLVIPRSTLEGQALARLLFFSADGQPVPDAAADLGIEPFAILQEGGTPAARMNARRAGETRIPSSWVRDDLDYLSLGLAMAGPARERHRDAIALLQRIGQSAVREGEGESIGRQVARLREQLLPKTAGGPTAGNP